MAAIRWLTSTVQASIARQVEAGLTSLGWFEDPPRWTNTPFAFDSLFNPESIVQGQAPSSTNLVGLSMGPTPDNIVQELGGGMQAVSIAAFFDIYSEKRGISQNLGDDIQAILQGELYSPSRYIPLYDYSADTPVLDTENALEARLVEARWGAGPEEYKRTWRVVSFTATLYWVGSGND